MTPAWWLLVAAAALAAASAEYPDLTLVLQPDEDFDWDQITRWMEQSHFVPEQTTFIQEPEPLPVASALTAYPAQGAGDSPPPAAPAFDHGAATPEPALPAIPSAESSASQGAEPALAPSSSPVLPGPAVMPSSSHVAAPGPAMTPSSSHVVPGPAMMPGSSHVVPGPAMMPSSSHLAPGPAMMPSSSLLLPGPPLMPGPSQGFMGSHWPAAPDATLAPSPEPSAPSPPASAADPDPAPISPPAPPAEAQPPASADFLDLRPAARTFALEETPPDDDYPGLVPGQRLLALEEMPAADRVVAVPDVGFDPTTGYEPAASDAPAMAPDVLAVLLQRLEERLVATENLQQQHATELRAIEHRQRKEEVVDRENMEAIRSEFDNIEHKVDNLQFDLGRMTTMLETIMNDVQMVQRSQREQTTAMASGGAAGKRAATGELAGAIAELSQKLGQLVVNTELLKGGQRRLGGNVLTIANRTSELSERSEEFATKVTVANSLSEMRSYLDQRQPATAFPPSKEDAALPGDCSDVLLEGHGSESGIYQVRPRGARRPIFVYCDHETDGGGWVVIQRRLNGEEDFFQDWLAYKYGFGNLGGEFWLGNENIHLLTNHRLNELRVELADFPRERPGYEPYPGSNATANYAAFAVGSETEGYSLKILDGYTGDAGDSLKYHAGMKFSTKDMDNDLWKEDSCAVAHKGGWWYKGCDSSNLNGLYLNGPVPSEYEYQVVYWYDWRGPLYSLYKTKMMVRPADHAQRAAGRKRGSGRNSEGGKTAAQRRSAQQTVRRGKRRRQRRRKNRRYGH